MILRKEHFKKNMPATFRTAMPHHWARARQYPGPNVGELLLVESPTVRRLLRAVSSGQAAITEAAGLVVGLAWLHPERLLDQTTTHNHLELARLRKTFSNQKLTETRCILHATRGLAAVEAAANQCGYSARWITEGLDMEKVAEILAIPADHAVLGLLAIDVPAGDVAAPDEFCWEGFMVNGFGGSWPKSSLPTGHGLA